jgi:hypothetical protein
MIKNLIGLFPHMALTSSLGISSSTTVYVNGSRAEQDTVSDNAEGATHGSRKYHRSNCMSACLHRTNCQQDHVTRIA